MIRALLAASLALWVATPAIAADNPDHAAFWRGARITIGADGKVTSLQFEHDHGKLATPDMLDQRLEKLIRTWAFQPGSVDGHPAITDTTLNLHLDMRKEDADLYDIALLDAKTGVGLGHVVPPDYPARELAGYAEAKVSLLVKVDETGKPTDVQVEAYAGDGNATSRRRFEAAALRAASEWRFKPEVVGEHPMPAVARIPVEFCLAVRSHCNDLVLEHPQPAGTPNNPVATLDSHARLLTQVAGVTF